MVLINNMLRNAMAIQRPKMTHQHDRKTTQAINYDWNWVLIFWYVFPMTINNLGADFLQTMHRSMNAVYRC
jgi:hypothetical protein